MASRPCKIVKFVTVFFKFFDFSFPLDLYETCAAERNFVHVNF